MPTSPSPFKPPFRIHCLRLQAQKPSVELPSWHTATFLLAGGQMRKNGKTEPSILRLYPTTMLLPSVGTRARPLNPQSASPQLEDGDK